MEQPVSLGDILQIEPSQASRYPGLGGRPLKVTALPNSNHPNQYEVLAGEGIGPSYFTGRRYWVDSSALMTRP